MAPREQLNNDLEEALLATSPEDSGNPNEDSDQRSSSLLQRNNTQIETDNNNDSNHHNQHQINRNIRLTLYYTAFAFAGRSIWSQSVLATYVYLLTNSNPEAVGLISAAMGISQLLASIPTGYFSDVYRRDTMLKLASLVGLVAVVVSLMAVYHTPRSFFLLVVALAVWGIFWGIANTALGALFADSIADGDRSYYFTTRSILINLGNTVGPALALTMFAVLGDSWTVRDCAIVMTLGQIVCLPAIFALLLFNDNDVPINVQPPEQNEPREYDLFENPEDSLSINGTEPLWLENPGQSNGSSSVETFDTALTNHNNVEGSGSLSTTNDEATVPLYADCANNPSNDGDEDSSNATLSPEYIYCCIPRHRMTPILVAIADLGNGLASGMSIRYFPIFFLDRLHFSPVQVQVLYIVSPLLQACLMKSGQFFSQRFGRYIVTIIHKWTGIACMALLVVCAHYGQPAWMICILYVLRTGFINSTTPLTKSILMDNVPAEERGRWSSLESVNMFSWSGSAAIGGLLVNWHGLLFNFSVTAALQLVATLPVIALMWTCKLDRECHRRS